jgi:hypothetical protein
MLTAVTAPMFALVSTWVVAAGLLLGCGYACRRLLLLAFRYDDTRRLRPADLWIGLAVLIAYLEVWSLAAPITAWALIAPCAVAGITAVLCVRRTALLTPVARVDRHVICVAAAVGVGLLWLANRSLGKPTSYDGGLYHFSAIEYATRFSAIPGLGNLHIRLAAGDAHLLFVAFLGNGPWRGGGFHVANGLLVAMLLTDILWRLADSTSPPVTRRLGLLLVPATIFVFALDPGGRLSSPSLDAPAFILVAAGTLYLVQSLERFEPGVAGAATAAFAVAAATRPQFLPATAIAGLTIAVLSPRAARTLVLVAIVPVVVFTAWSGRQAVLSGYPLFPLRLGALPVDWRVPGAAVDTMNDVVRAWARTPRETPATVLGSWDWLPGWLRRSATDLDVLCPFLLTVFAALRLRGATVNMRVLAAALLPLAFTLVVWFFVAPDPRFVYGPLWLVPLLLLAVRPLDRRDGAVCASFAGLAVLAGGAWWPVLHGGDGPFGSVGPPSPAVRSIRTESGLAVLQPVDDDRCWKYVVCAPSVDRHLRLRGTDIGSGFRTS